MPKIEGAIKEAITRGADRRVRLVVIPLRREVHRLRRLIAQLRRDVGALRVVAGEWQRAAQATPFGAGISEDEVRAARFSARLIQKLRARLGLSQMALGRLGSAGRVSKLPVFQERIFLKADSPRRSPASESMTSPF